MNFFSNDYKMGENIKEAIFSIVSMDVRTSKNLLDHIMREPQTMAFSKPPLEYDIHLFELYIAKLEEKKPMPIQCNIYYRADDLSYYKKEMIFSFLHYEQ